MNPPEHRLPEAALRLWRMQAALAGAVAVLLAGTAAGWIWGLPVLGVALAGVVVVPGVRWRRWRYEVRSEEIDLRHGLWTEKRTLVPIRRVQHVDTSTGLLQARFDLSTVTIYTAAGHTEIPALTRPEADAVRRRIGELARTRDDT